MTQASEAARKASTEASISNAPLTPWTKLTAPPPLPILAKRNGHASREFVGTLRENLRVRTNKHTRQSTKIFIEQPTNAQAAEGRRKGDAVYMRLSEKLIISAKYEFVDAIMNFVPERAVAIAGGRRITAQQKQKIARLLYHEVAVRSALYNRDVAVYLARVRLWYSWYPAAAAQVPKVMTREDARAAVRKQLRGAKDVLAEFDDGSLDMAVERSAHVRARELRKLRDGLVECGCEAADALDDAAAGVPEAAPFVDFEIFEDVAGTVDDDVAEMQEQYSTVQESRAAARAALACGFYNKKRVTKGKAVLMAKILGWDRAAFVANRPGYASCIRGFYW